MNRRTPVLAAAVAVMAASVLAGYGAAAGGRTGPPSDTSGFTEPVEILIAGQHHPEPEPSAGAVPNAAPEVEPEGNPEAAHQTAPSPERLIREVHVLHARTQTPSTSPLPASTDDCPSPVTCPVHQVRGARFPTDEEGNVAITWHFNDEGRRNLRAEAGLLESAMAWATAEWSRWNPKVSFSYEGTTDALFGAQGEDGTCADGTNAVTWERFDPSIIAAVVVCYDEARREIRDADLALNVSQHWEDIYGQPRSRHTFDIRSIVTHEIGHWLSVDDLYTSDAAGQTMFGHASYGETHKRTLALGDIVGLQTVYPCGEGDICPREGIVDD